MSSETLSSLGIAVDKDLLALYAFYSSILVLKVLFMSWFTGVKRFKTKSFTNPEDVKKGTKVKIDDEVERVRRAHLNDLENIVPFLFVSFLYVLTGPNLLLAGLLFKVFTAARFVHTFVYAVYVVPQPARGLSWMTGYTITLFMAAATIFHFY